MPGQSLLSVPAKSAETLRALAEQSQVSCEAYTEQSLKLGLWLAGFVVHLPEEADPRILFEGAGGAYAQYPIDFSSAKSTDPPAAAIDGVVIPAQRPLVLELNPDLFTSAQVVADGFGVSKAHYIESCYFYRWQWAVAREFGREILLHEGLTPHEYISVEEDPFLRQ